MNEINLRENLVAFHQLNVPSTLNATFLGTNCIENSFRNWREATGNVKRWSLKRDMVSRWNASGMLWAESGFNKIRHPKDLEALESALSASITPTSLRPPRYARRSPLHQIMRSFILAL